MAPPEAALAAGADGDPALSLCVLWIPFPRLRFAPARRL
jgi:hypothetical protein